MGGAFRADGDVVILLGESHGELGGSEYLKTVHGLVRGMPPALDLAREAALQRVLVDVAQAGLVASAHDCAEGGLAVTLAECCFDAGLGVEVNVPAVAASAAGFVDVRRSSVSRRRERWCRRRRRTRRTCWRSRGARRRAGTSRSVESAATRIRLSVDGRVAVDDRGRRC